MQFGHDLEIHAVDPGNQGWQNTDPACNGQDLHAVILLNVDKAKGRVQQKLDLVDELDIEIVQRSYIPAGNGQATAEECAMLCRSLSRRVIVRACVNILLDMVFEMKAYTVR